MGQACAQKHIRAVSHIKKEGANFPLPLPLPEASHDESKARCSVSSLFTRFPVSKSHGWRKSFHHLSIPVMMSRSVELLTSGMASHRMAPSVMFFKNDCSSIRFRTFHMRNLMEGEKAEEVWPATIKTNIPEQTATREVGFCFF